MASVCRLWRSIVCQHQTALTLALPPGALAPAAEQCLLSAAARRPAIRRLAVTAQGLGSFPALLLLLRLLPGLSSISWEDRSSGGGMGMQVSEMPAVSHKSAAPARFIAQYVTVLNHSMHSVWTEHQNPSHPTTQLAIAQLLPHLATLRLLYPARLPASFGALTSLARLRLQQRSPSLLELPASLSGLCQLSLLRAAGDLNGTGAAELGGGAVLAALPALRRLELQCLRLVDVTWLQARRWLAESSTPVARMSGYY